MGARLTVDEPRAADLDQLVREEVSRFLEQRHGRRPSLAEGSRLEADLGLSSLDLAALMARLHDRLGRPPSPAVAHTELRTFGDLLSAVGRPDAAPAAGDAADDPLARARARADARRRSRPDGA